MNASHLAMESLPPGVTWEKIIAHAIARHGSLASVASHIAEQKQFKLDTGTIERGLRRLRSRENLPGGTYGRLLLQVVGLPASTEERLRWMGCYHSRFTDLPITVCEELLRVWNRPPANESNARIWLHLGLASTSQRKGSSLECLEHITQARLSAHRGSLSARIELALLESFVLSRSVDRDASREKLDEAGRLLSQTGLSREDALCFRARYVDQLAWRLNNPPVGTPPAYEDALALYDTIPEDDSVPFASVRRENGRAFGYWKLGQTEKALSHASTAIRHAGDGGFLRLRVMALGLYARIATGDAAHVARERAVRIAKQLEDEVLLGRLRPRDGG